MIQVRSEISQLAEQKAARFDLSLANIINLMVTVGRFFSNAATHTTSHAWKCIALVIR